MTLETSPKHVLYRQADFGDCWTLGAPRAQHCKTMGIEFHIARLSSYVKMLDYDYKDSPALPDAVKMPYYGNIVVLDTFPETD